MPMSSLAVMLKDVRSRTSPGERRTLHLPSRRREGRFSVVWQTKSPAHLCRLKPLLVVGKPCGQVVPRALARDTDLARSKTGEDLRGPQRFAGLTQNPLHFVSDERAVLWCLSRINLCGSWIMAAWRRREARQEPMPCIQEATKILPLPEIRALVKGRSKCVPACLGERKKAVYFGVRHHMSPSHKDERRYDSTVAEGIAIVCAPDTGQSLACERCADRVADDGRYGVWMRPRSGRAAGGGNGRSHTDLKDQRGVWMAFHFIPGNAGAEYTERQICDRDSVIARGRHASTTTSRYTGNTRHPGSRFTRDGDENRTICEWERPAKATTWFARETVPRGGVPVHESE